MRPIIQAQKRINDGRGSVVRRKEATLARCRAQGSDPRENACQFQLIELTNALDDCIETPRVIARGSDGWTRHVITAFLPSAFQLS